MERSAVVFFLLLTAFSTSAQLPTFRFYSSAGGSFTRQDYDTNIVRIVFHPAGGTAEPNLSDAVILKPSGPVEKVRADTSRGLIVIGARPGQFVISTHHTGDYRGFLFTLRDAERIFGGGERALPLNRRGYRLNLYNNPWYGYGEGADNLNYSVPFVTSSKGYALFFDNPSRGYIDVGKTQPDVLEYGASSGELNVYVIFGNYQQILRSYHKLTGTQPLPPRWSFGNLMSRFGYTSESNVKEIYGKMKAARIPVDAVIFDLFWFGDSIKGTMGNLDWVNRSKWPSPKRMIADFKKEGVQTLLVTEPFFVETSANYRASRPYLSVDSAGRPYVLTDFYFGKGGLIDIFRKDAQQWFWNFYRRQMLNGVEAWWGDLGEPEKHPSNLYHNGRDLGVRRLLKADEVHNLYGHAWTKMLYEQFAKEYPDKRLFSLNRSGFAGSQRYGIMPWTGDVSRSWTGLKAQLPVLLGMTMSGVPYVHSDAGGFAGGEGDNELYIRWLQFACFTPVFRPHGTALYEMDTAAKSFPSEAALIDPPYRNMARNIILNRYRLLPYNYTLAYQQAKYGRPLMAPLYYYFPADTSALNAEDQFMWGAEIMVAPVLEKGAATRSYYLPEGQWYHPSKQVMLQGGRRITDSVDLESVPLLLREGSFVPYDGRSSGNTNTSSFQAAELSVLYTPSDRPSKYELYLDDGKTRGNMAAKKFELITFSSAGYRNNALRFTIQTNKGVYPGRPPSRTIRLQLPGLSLPVVLLVNGKPVPVQRMSQVGKDLYLPFTLTGDTVRVEMRW